MFKSVRCLASSFLLATALAFPSSFASAQSSLGVAGFSIELGADDGRFDGQLFLDTAVTEFHGLQLELGLTDYADGAVGQLAAHLYMTPVDGQKYGLFGVLGDVDGRSLTYGTVGIEGLFSVMPNTVLGVSGGLGLADPGSWDYIYLDARLSHPLWDRFQIDYGLTLTEIDEPGLSDVGTEVGIGLRYNAPNAAWGGFAEARYDEIDGDDSVTLRAGITFTLGRDNGSEPKDRLFRTADPLGPLFRRGRL